ncbi:hypothetical protein MTO96_010391 [Rhipicephalus appendiculatus]
MRKEPGNRAARAGEDTSRRSVGAARDLLMCLALDSPRRRGCDDRERAVCGSSTHDSRDRNVQSAFKRTPAFLVCLIKQSLLKPCLITLYRDALLPQPHHRLPVTAFYVTTVPDHLSAGYAREPQARDRNVRYFTRLA